MKKLTTYMFYYRYDGKKFAVDIPAYSLEEAEGRLSCMSLGRFKHTVEARIPAYLPAAPILVRLWCWIANFFSSNIKP